MVVCDHTCSASFSSAHSHSCSLPLSLFLPHTTLCYVRLFLCRVLDYGCGSGIYSVELLKRGATVVAADVAKEMLAQVDSE
jgi:2-polyprenyl-3-methyl-5-hydroxy-6-metoxy-1,4-benzoquinol methylase